MAKASFLQQLKALVWRNLLLKKRNRKGTIQEILMPIYFVLLLAFIKWISTPKPQLPVPKYPIHSLHSTSYLVDPRKVLYVTPNTTRTKELATELTKRLRILAIPPFRAFNKPEDAEHEYKKAPKEVLAGLDFIDGNLRKLEYTLRFPHGKVPSTLTNVTSNNPNCGNSSAGTTAGCTADQYLFSGFCYLQQMLDSILIEQSPGSGNVTIPKFAVQLMPKHKFEPETQSIQILSAIYFVMAYAPIVAFLTVSLLTEKEKKFKEAMRMMGMRDSAFWCSWAIVYVFVILIITSVVTLLAFVAKFFMRSNLLLFFLLLYLYGLSIVNIAFILTPFFSKASTGGALASLGTILLSLLYLPVTILRAQSNPVPVWVQYLLSLLSPVALSLGMDRATVLDAKLDGLNFQTMTTGDFPFSASLIMLTVDIVLYALLAFYLDNVIPNEYGMRRPPWFFLMPSFWCRRKARGLDGESLLNQEHGHIGQDIMLTVDSENCEAVPADLRHSDKLKIYNMKKSFKSDGKEVKAVNGVTLDMFEGQITALLGHNGAGKTTLLNMLTGMTRPTSGSATIYGLDVTDSNDLTELRTMIGVCPQHNITFDDLTTRQQLSFYGSLKGVPSDRIDAEVEQALRDVDLVNEADTYGENLSGGQKRKTCVAIALIGNPRVLFLDEPTAGMDPYSRRHLWKLLKAQKKNKLIVLTTHFMDEADILADRKTIMSKGQLRCTGSSLFLKNRFGVGYHLSMVLDPTASVTKITEIMTEHIPSAVKHRHHGKELSYTLPITAVGSFQNLFGALEGKNGDGTPYSEQLGIITYGVSMTTLEDVFLKLGEEAEAVDEVSPEIGNQEDKQPMLNTTTAVTMENVQNGASPTVEFQAFRPEEGKQGSVTGRDLARQRFRALLKNKALILLSNKPRFIFQVVFPVAFLLVAATLSKVMPTPKAPTLTPLPLHASLYAYINNTPSSVKNPSMVYSPQDGDIDLINAVRSLQVPLWDYHNMPTLFKNSPHYVGFHFSAPSTGDDVVALYNASGVHSLPVIINTLSSALIKMKNSSLTISTISKPWPQLTISFRQFSGGLFASVLLFGIAITSIPASFGVNVLNDRLLKIKTQLRLAGVSMNMYWGAVMTFDLIQFWIACLVALIIMLAFQVPFLMNVGAVIAVLLVYVFYIPLNMLFAYILSFAFKKFETAQSILPNIIMWGGFLPYMVVSLLDMLQQEAIATPLHYALCCLIPPYPVFGALYYIQKVYTTQLYIQGFNPSIPISAYFKFTSHIPIVYLIPFIHSVWMYLLLRYLEVRSTGGDHNDVLNCRGSHSSWTVPLDNTDVPEGEDDDVTAERQRVNQDDQARNMVVKVQGLRKEYPKNVKKKFCKKPKNAQTVHVAVRNSSFLVETGEVFGLLGPNGAGKTTTLNMIIADTGPTRGKISVAGHDVRSNLSEAFQEMAYCPQHDAVWEDISLKQHLECYAACRGIPPDLIPNAINYFMEALAIKEHADKPAKKLSGGTKRKLSYAISMLNEPKVVLLDEPSTGMDPKSKRFMWDAISNAFNNDSRGAILTTHYMDEADALCSRVAIMVNGRIECLGSTQHLKNKYGGGYHLEVKLQPSMSEETGQERMAALRRFIEAAFPGAVQNEEFEDRTMYRIPQTSVPSLAHTFASLERGKEELGIEEYSFSQATLEQVFLEFAKHQVDENNIEAQQASRQARALFQQHSYHRNMAATADAVADPSV